MIETVRGVRNRISPMASKDCNHPLRADTPVASHYDPVGLSARTSWRASIHVSTILANWCGWLQSPTFRFYENLRSFHLYLEIARDGLNIRCNVGDSFTANNPRRTW